MGACHVHGINEPGCMDCLQDERDCYRAEVNQLRGVLQIASLEPAGEHCVRCAWNIPLDGSPWIVTKQCWPCKRIEYLEKLVGRIGNVFDAPEIREGVLIVPHELAADVLTICLKLEKLT